MRSNGWRTISIVLEILFGRDIDEDEKVYWLGGKLSSETNKTGNVSNTRVKIAKTIFRGLVSEEIK